MTNSKHKTWAEEQLKSKNLDFTNLELTIGRSDQLCITRESSEVNFEYLQKLSEIFKTKKIDLRVDSYEGSDGYYPCTVSTTYIYIQGIKWPQ